MGTLIQDLRYAARSLRKSPGFTATVVLALGLGIGATVVIASAFDHVVLRPLGYPEADRLVVVRENIQGLAQRYPSLGGNARHYLEWKRECHSCESIGAARATQLTLTGDAEAEQLDVLRISSSLFPVLGGAPEIGRVFGEGDRDAGSRVVLLADAFWRRKFGADPSVVGRSILLNNQQWQVVGVMPPTFRFPRWQQVGGQAPERIDLFVPLSLTDREATTPGEFDYAVIAKLREGQTPARLQLELDGLEERLTREGPPGMTVRAMVTPLQVQVVGTAARPLAVLLAAVGAVLAIVCVNLSSLVLARNLARGREAALRVALGAGRTRLVRQILAEAVILGISGGALGVLLSNWGLASLLSLAPPGLPRLGEITLDTRTLLVSLGLSVVAAFGVGIIPAVRASRSDPAEALKGGGRSVTHDRRARNVRSGLIVSQVALTVVLLISAGLLVTSFARVLQVDRGFEGESVLAMDITLPTGAYDLAGQRTVFYDEILDRLGGLPGVRDAAVTTKVPLEGETQVDFISLETDTRPVTERPTANILYVSPRYFAALGIHLRGGRVFSQADRGRPVVVLSSEAARAVWNNADDALGNRVVPGSNDPEAEVVGLVSDVRNASLEYGGSLIAYLPYWQRPPQNATVVLRTQADPTRVAGEARALLREIAPLVPVRTVRTMDQVVALSLATRRFQLLLLGLFACSALLTATIGIYGIVSQSLAGRANEIGVRLAIGARPGDVRRLVLREGLLPVGAGILVGTGVAIVVGRMMTSLLFQVRGADPFNILIVATLVLGITAIACWFPARRAARLDPAMVLRNE